MRRQPHIRDGALSPSCFRTATQYRINWHASSNYCVKCNQKSKRILKIAGGTLHCSQVKEKHQRKNGLKVEHE